MKTRVSISVLLLAAFAIPAMGCERPAAPGSIPDGKSASKEEMLAAMRNANVKTFDDVDSIVLETDGTFSIVWQNADGKRSSLIDVPEHPDFVPDEKRPGKH